MYHVLYAENKYGFGENFELGLLSDHIHLRWLSFSKNNTLIDRLSTLC